MSWLIPQSERSVPHKSLGSPCSAFDLLESATAGCLRLVPWTRIRFLSASYRIAFRKKIYRSIDELQADLDACGLIRVAGASARPRCRLFLTHCHWRGRNSWLLDH